MTSWKEKYRKINHNSYSWCEIDGTLDGEDLHIFQRESRDVNNTLVYESIKCKESELFDVSKKTGKSSFQTMADMGITR